MDQQRISFGPFEIDRAAQVVLRDGEPLGVGARGVRLLEALLRRPGEVLTKNELIDAAWGGAAVEESNLSVQVAALRKALGEGADGREWIATVPRVGYRFVGDLQPEPAPRFGDKRSIAVLPFENLSADPDQSFFADGLAEEIITALARVSGLLVIARASSFAYRGRNVDLRQVGQELDVQYVLAGSVRRSGEQLRMAVQLVDARTAANVWAERFDRRLTDVFAIQDEVARQVVASLSVHLSPREAETLMGSGTADVEALDLLARGRGLISAPTQDRTTNDEAIALLQAAIARDPGYVAAYVSLIIALITAYSNRWTDDPARTLEQGRDAGEKLIALAPHDGEARAARSLVAMLERDHDRLRVETELATELAPDSGLANILRGGFFVNDGQPLLAIPFYERAIRVNPAMAHLYVHHLGTAYLFAERYETAAALFRSRILLSPRTDMSRAYLCVALGHLGEVEEARRVWAELMEITPSYSLAERLSWWHYRNSADPERLLEGLRKAGLPTGAVGS